MRSTFKRILKTTITNSYLIAPPVILGGCYYLYTNSNYHLQIIKSINQDYKEFNEELDKENLQAEDPVTSKVIEIEETELSYERLERKNSLEFYLKKKAEDFLKSEELRIRGVKYLESLIKDKKIIDAVLEVLLFSVKDEEFIQEGIDLGKFLIQIDHLI